MGVGAFGEQERVADGLSVLLELAAADDLIGFKTAVEEQGLDVDGFGLWYGRRVGSKKIGLEERTPLMVASMFGSTRVLMYILETGCVDVNRACGSDGATALHCAVFGGSAVVVEVVKLLLDASSDVNCVDVEGNRPSDLIVSFVSSSYHSKRKTLEFMLKGCADSNEAFILDDETVEKLEDQLVEELSSLQDPKDGTERKDYPVDLSLPDIKNGIYGSDEFRMYTFKIKPCSRAYSHDWTECPFAHPGENARRRDPRKFHYSCVPCPEFRKGACRQGDACEYAHGIFECWLHPAQYRTRLCKDEVGCNRKVCFFAHKPEELRPLYASSGSAVPSSLDFLAMSSLALGSPSLMISPSSTPPMTPSGPSSPMAGSMWSNQSNFAPPTLNLSGSRLRTTRSARDMDLEAEFLGMENHRRRQQQLLDELSGLSSPTARNNFFSSSAAFASSQGDWNGEHNRFSGLMPTNLDDVFGSHDPTILSHLQGLSLDTGTTQLQSSTGTSMRHSMNQQLRSSYPSHLSSSPARSSQSFGIDQAGAAASFATARSSAFAKRSRSFIDRSAVTHHPGISSTSAAAMSDWGSPNGKLEWGIQKEELNKLRKSASFGLRNNGSSYGAPAALITSPTKEHDSWPMVKDIPAEKSGHYNIEESNLNNGGSEMLPQWVEQFYMDQEQLVA
ncbi:zinc finger CCCH domain-containing protein 66 [Apium graveolens]|uniref:zinc finger CCCH domain-containing protein 66 n=1 Tax=Apium graveolens TaxID=4045 RepID=UPI003D78B491